MTRDSNKRKSSELKRQSSELKRKSSITSESKKKDVRIQQVFLNLLNNYNLTNEN